MLCLDCFRQVCQIGHFVAKLMISATLTADVLQNTITVKISQQGCQVAVFRPVLEVWAVLKVGGWKWLEAGKK